MSEDRLSEMCSNIWSMLTEEERAAYYYDTGIIGFVEDVAAMLHCDVNELTDEAFDKVLEKLA